MSDDDLSQQDIDSMIAAARGGGSSAAGASPFGSADTSAASDDASVPSPTPAGPSTPSNPLGLPSCPARTVRRMDFSRPNKFSKDQLRTVQMLQDAYCRRAASYLSGAVRSVVESSVASTEQIPYADFVSGLPVPTFTAILEIAPLGTNALLSIDLPLLFGILDRMLGGPGSASSVRMREPTDIEIQLARTMTERLLVELTGAWSELVGIEFRLVGVEMNAHFVQIATNTEPGVLSTMDVSISTAAGQCRMYLPYRSIEKVVSELTAQRYFSQGTTEEGESRERIIGNLRGVTMPVRALVAEAQVPVEDLLTLRSGDILTLGHLVSDGMRLVVGNTRAYRATPGRDGQQLAVRIVDSIKPGEAA